MYHHQAKRALWVGVLLCFVAVLLPAASAAQRGFGAAAPASFSRSFHFTYNDKPPLLNSVKKTLKGDKVTIAGHDFTVVEMRGRRVTKVLVAPRPAPAATAARGA